MLHLNDLFHSVPNQCYRMLIICSPERFFFFLPVVGQNWWLIASNAGHKLLWQIYPLKTVLYLQGKLSPFPHTGKSKTKGKRTLQNKIEINLVLKSHYGKEILSLMFLSSLGFCTHSED